MDTTNKEHPKEVLGGLNLLRERSELTDVVLEVEGRSFPCHRAVLASCSPYFRSMFTSGYAEDKQGRITIQDVSQVAMATILDYAYTGCLRTEPDQVQAVMSAARLLQVDFVCRKAAEYMRDLLDVSNCTDVLMYADMMGDLSLQEASGRYMASRFHQVALQPSFLQLSLSQLQSLLDRDDLITCSEDDVVQAALRWVNFDQGERMQHLPALCKSIRYPFISSKCCVELESGCQSREGDVEYSNTASRRLGQVRKETMIFLQEDFPDIDFVSSIPCYEPLSGVLYSMNLPGNVDGYSMARTPDDELYLAGGIDRTLSLSLSAGAVVPRRLKAFFQYNHLLNTWEARCEMISPRVRCGLVYLKGFIYAIGGDNMKETAERYDPSSDIWTSIAPVPHPLSSEVCAVALDDSIYVISKDGCYRFGAKDNTWSRIADMLSPPLRPQAVTHQGRIYCMDSDKDWGDSSLTHVEMYNPTNDVWKRSGNDVMSFSFDVGILMVYMESLYLLTVFNKYEPDHFNLWENKITLYQYHPDSDSWLKQNNCSKMVPPMTKWLGSGSRTDCLVARVIPSCLGDASAYKDQELRSDDEDDDETISDSSGSGSSDDSDSEEDPSDQDSGDDDDINNETDSDDI